MTQFESDVYFKDIQPWALSIGKVFENKNDMIDAFWLDTLTETVYSINCDSDSEPFTQYDFGEECPC